MFRGLSHSPSHSPSGGTDYGASTGVAPMPLPPLPLAAGAKVMGLGHSWLNRAYDTSGTQPTITGLLAIPRGVMPWIKYLDQRFNIDALEDPTGYNNNYLADATNALSGSGQGIGGDFIEANVNGAPGTIPRTPYCIARRPHIVYLHIGSTDVSGSFTTAQMIDKFTRQLSLFRAAGIWVIAHIVDIRGDWAEADGAGRYLVRTQFNTWLKAQVGALQGLYGVVDTASVFGDTKAGQSLTYFNSDKIHPSMKGAYALATQVSVVTIAGTIATGLLGALQAMVSSGTYYNVDPTTADNLFPSTAMTGTTGTKTNVSGNVATSFAAVRTQGGSTIVASKEAIDGSHDKQVFTITPVNDGLNGNWHAMTLNFSSAPPTLATLGIVAGDYLQASALVEFDSWAGWSGIELALRLKTDTTDVNTMRAMSVPTIVNQPWPSAAIAANIVTDPVLVTPDMTTWQGNVTLFLIKWQSDIDTNAHVVKISKPKLAKVTNPFATWYL